MSPAARSEPIPVYAEMSSVNPVFILPAAMKERRSQIATGLHGSVTLGVGQFCTNPGLVMIDGTSDSDQFASELGELMRESPAGTMLTAGIRESYRGGVAKLKDNESVITLAHSANDSDDFSKASATVFSTTASAFLSDSTLAEEVFGPSTLLVKSESRDQLLELARSLEGQLTATIHATDDDLAEFADLVRIIETRVGRLVMNGFPTGVEVCDSIVHGGPYPATSDGRSTSVGTGAILRFARMVGYQGYPDGALPDELKNGNPLRIWRTVDGKRVAADGE